MHSTVYFYTMLMNLFFLGQSVHHLRNYIIQSTYMPGLNSQKIKRSSNKCNYLAFNISNNEYTVCIQLHDAVKDGIVNDDVKIYMQDFQGTNVSNITDFNIRLYKGYAVNYEAHSYISGYVHNDRFYGKIQLPAIMFYIEPVTHFPEIAEALKLNFSQDALIYEYVDDNKMELSNQSLKYSVLNNSKWIENLVHEYGPIEKFNGKLCSLTVAIDNSFLQRIAKGSLETAVNIMVYHADESNALLRSTDFDGDSVPDNIGIQIQNIILIVSKYKNLGSIIKTPIRTPVDPKLLLQKFTTFEFLQYTCLGLLVTAQPFINNLLGVSFTPSKNLLETNRAGICSHWTKFGYPLNTLLITYTLSTGEILPDVLIDINLAHELAHSFGSDHDSGECLTGHLMTPHTSLPKNISNYMFSECTKRDILMVLRKQGHCLVDVQDSFCGNGLVEEDEECDCGSFYNCLENDKCCHTRNSKAPCKVNKVDYQCHPSQGLCCEHNCQYRNLSHIGLLCHGFENKCPCTNGTDCTCGVMGRCLQTECHSVECTRIGLRECQCKQTYGYKCDTCCLNLDGKCVSSRSATRHILRTNIPQKLYDYEVKTSNPKPNEVIETFCIKNRCIKLGFRVFDTASFCLYRGDVGLCIRSLCIVPRFPTNIYPNIEIKNANIAMSNCFTYFDLFLFMFLSCIIRFSFT